MEHTKVPSFAGMAAQLYTAVASAKTTVTNTNAELVEMASVLEAVDWTDPSARTVSGIVHSKSEAGTDMRPAPSWGTDRNKHRILYSLELSGKFGHLTARIGDGRTAINVYLLFNELPGFITNSQNPELLNMCHKLFTDTMESFTEKAAFFKAAK